MAKYAAFLRGIGPTNPNMKGEKLRAVFESLGFTNVQSIINSGNLIFESKSTDTAMLESMIETALPDQLDFTSKTFVRSAAELQKLVDADPFKGMTQSPKTYITITFLKARSTAGPKLPYTADSKGYTILKLYDRALSAILDQTQEKTPNMMTWLERTYSKEITTRTWKTVTRVLAKLGQR